MMRPAWATTDLGLLCPVLRTRESVLYNPLFDEAAHALCEGGTSTWYVRTVWVASAFYLYRCVTSLPPLSNVDVINLSLSTLCI
jgi:hypothetical protein